MAQNFDILIEDSDTSITVKMEYLFAFQFWFCELCVECREVEAGSIILLIFAFSVGEGLWGRTEGLI